MIIEKIKSNRGFVDLCKCDYCDKEFYRIANQAERHKYQYCTYDCSVKAKIGSGNPNFGKHWDDKHKTILSIKAKKRTGEMSSNWKGGRIKRLDGYIAILKPNHPFADVKRRVMEHRLVMENYLKRYLKPEEQVHHINGIKDDNRIENLMLFASNSDHIKFHKEKELEYKCRMSTKNTLSSTNLIS
jgi:hypothetical protein